MGMGIFRIPCPRNTPGGLLLNCSEDSEKQLFRKFFKMSDTRSAIRSVFIMLQVYKLLIVFMKFLLSFLCNFM